MTMRSIFLVLVTALLLTACNAGPQVGAGNSLFRTLPGSEFILHADIEIPPGLIRASFQGGKLLNGASEFEPRCELEIKNFSEEPQIIHAGTYTISKVLGMDRYVTRPDENVMLAAAGVLQLVSDTSDWYMNTYQMTLQSDVYTDAPVLICGGVYSYGYDGSYPSLQEMLTALGSYAEIRLR